MTPDLDRIAAKLAAGARPDDTDAQALAASRDLVALGMLADEDRRRRHGARVTFVRVLDVPVGDAAGIDAGVPPAAREIRLGGTPDSIAHAVAAVRRLSRLAPGVPLTGFSLEALVSIADSESLPLRVVASRLREAGLEAVAGVSVLLPDADAAVTEARAAGLGVWRLTVPAGSSSAPDAPLAFASSIQRAVGGFRALAPLAADPDPGQPTTGYDDVRRVALARLLVDNVDSIQVDWRGYGPKLAQVALVFGADDVDGVSPLDARELGARRATIEELRRNVRAASLEAAERDGRFAVLET